MPTTTAARQLAANGVRRRTARSSGSAARRGGRWLPAAVSAASAALVLWLAAHHPLSPSLAVAACAAAAAAAFARPVQWPLWLMALLPLAGLMPWSGWLLVEELDLLVLAVCAGGYLRLAAAGAARPLAQPGDGLARLWLVVLPLLLSTLVGLQRGIDDAGGLQFGWWQGYSEPMNSVRLAKPLFEALLLLPLWRAACRIDAAGAARALRHGMLAMLVVAGLTVVWERLAFTGLLDFSSDYRATGLFWEMHVGGAALDAVLVMSLPFAVAALLRARTPLRWAAAAAAAAVGIYACLVTFSRIVYLALPLALLVGWWLQRRQRKDAAASSSRAEGSAPRWAAPAGAAAYLLAAAIVFPGSGYRGLLALCCAAALLLPLIDVLRRCRLNRAFAAMVAVFATALVAACWALMAKGAYLAYAASAAATALLLVQASRRPSPRTAAAALGGFAGVLAAFAAVALHWGGQRAFGAAVVVTGGMLLLLPVAVLRRAAVPPAEPGAGAPPPVLRWRQLAQTVALLAALSAGIGVFDGGAYMSGRLSQSGQDSDLRRAHWQHALSLLNGPADWAFGKGLGRYHAQYALSGVAADQTGDYRLVPRADGGHALVLASGRHALGFGEIFRVSQRLAPGVGASQQLVLRLDIRSPQPVDLHAEVCEKHLLYPGACRTGDVHVAAGADSASSTPIASSTGSTGGRSGSGGNGTAGTAADATAWRALSLPLVGEDAFQRASLLPRLVAFSIGLDSRGSRVEIDNLRLADAGGGELLLNGDFERGMQRWFFSSDRYHLPWHAKNQLLHLLFEQGWFGVAGFGLLTAAAAWRLLRQARGHPLAPTLAAAICGVLVVGAVDSLLDMPRVAWLLFVLLAVAVSLPSDRLRAGAADRPPAPRR